MEIKLKSLEMEGFRSFKDRQIINFPDGDVLILISGKWSNSSVSSGSGKTSIIEAIAFCLDLSSASAATLKNWDSKKMYVKLTLSVGTDIVEIVRDPKLSIAINGVPYEGLVKGAKEKLQELLGENPDMLKSITYRKQRVKGQLVNSTDSQIKDFLTQPLGLTEVELAVDKFTQTANKIQSSLELLKYDVTKLVADVLSNTVNDQDEINANISLQQTQQGLAVAEAGLQTAVAAYTSAQSSFPEAQSLLDAATAKLNALSSDLQAATLNNDASLLKEEINKINKVILLVQSKKQENGHLRESIVNLQNEIDSLSSGVCPTCKRDWDTSVLLKQQKIAQLDKLISTMQINVEYIKNSEPLALELPNLNNKLQIINQKIGEAAAPLDAARQNVQIAQQGVNAAKSRISTAESNISMAKHGVSSASNAIRGAQLHLENLESKKANLQIIKQKLFLAKEKLRATEKEVEINNLCARTLGKTGFLGSIFDEILLEIQTRTNDMLAHYPNANQFTVEINSTKLVKSKGTTKKEISIDVSKYGKSVSLEDDLSGGQQAAIELCLDLALSETIRARSSKSLKWVCLDEVMDGLGSTEKESVVQMIKQRAKGLVLMIEHATEIKESFDNIIMVEYDGKTSNIVA